MSKSIFREKVINAFKWSLIERLSYQAIHFVFAIILARLLEPHHFGLIGMITIFIAISNLIIDGGFGHAIIRDPSANTKEYTTVFFLNIILSCLLYFILYATAPLIASFYKESFLKILIRIISLTLIINSFCIVQDTILVKELKFKKISYINIISLIISGFFSISLALAGKGIWALIIQQLSFSCVKAILYWLISNWKPRFAFEYGVIKKYGSFAANLLSIGLLNVIYDNIYNLIIGKIYDSKSLGYYTQAQRIQQIPTQNITSIVMKVSFPALSEIQEDNERLRAFYRQIFIVLFFIVFPLMIMLIITAYPLFEIILTKKWLSSVPYFQLMCIIGITYPLNTVLGNVFKVKNRLKTALYIRILEKIAITLVILLTMKINIVTMIAGLVIVNIMVLFMNMFFAGRLIEYSIPQQIKDLLLIFIITLFSTILAYYTGLLVDNSLLKLVLQLTIGFFSYFAISYFFNYSILRLILSLI